MAEFNRKVMNDLMSEDIAKLCDVDVDLLKVRSFDKRQDLYNILHSEDADHYSRLYLAGFLKFVGYSMEDVCNIIDRECSWEDYDARMTYNQVKSIFRNNDTSISSQFTKVATMAGNTFQRVSCECTHTQICLFFDVSE